MPGAGSPRRWPKVYHGEATCHFCNHRYQCGADTEVGCGGDGTEHECGGSNGCAQNPESPAGIDARIDLIRYIGRNGRIIDARSIWERACDLRDEGLAAKNERCFFTLTEKGLSVLREREE